MIQKYFLLIFLIITSSIYCIEGIEPEYPLDEMIKDNFTLKNLLQTGEEKETNRWFFALNSEVSQVSNANFCFGDSLYFFGLQTTIDSDGIHESEVRAEKDKNYAIYQNYKWKHKIPGNYNFYKSGFHFNLNKFYSENEVSYHSVDKQFILSGNLQHYFNSLISKLDYKFVSKPESSYQVNPWLFIKSNNFIFGAGLNIIDNDSLSYNPSACFRYNPNLKLLVDLSYKHELEAYNRQAHFDEFQLLWESEADQEILKSNITETLKAELEYRFLKSKLKLAGLYSKSDNKFDYEWMENKFKIRKINKETERIRFDFSYSNYWLTIGGCSEFKDVINFEPETKIFTNLKLRIYPLTYIIPDFTWIDGLEINDQNYSIAKTSVKLLFSLSSAFHFSLGFQENWDFTEDKVKRLSFDNSEIPYKNRVYFIFFLGSYDQFASMNIK